jgi:hypothetical protein
VSAGSGLSLWVDLKTWALAWFGLIYGLSLIVFGGRRRLVHLLGALYFAAFAILSGLISAERLPLALGRGGIDLGTGLCAAATVVCAVVAVLELRRSFKPSRDATGGATAQ